MDALRLEVELRPITGKQVVALRRQGITPIHLYGKGVAPLPLQADSPTLQKLVVRAGRNVPVSVSVRGTQETHLAFIREIQRHPVTEAILHVDFYQVSLAERMRAQVPLYLTGEAPAVRAMSGSLFHALRFIEVDCLPLDLPQYVEVNVSGLIDFEQAIYVSSIKLGDAVTILTDPNELIARVNQPRVVVEEAAAPAAAGAPEAAGEAAEGAESQEKKEGAS